MKSSYFFIFLSIVLVVYSLVHIYLYNRGVQIFSLQSQQKKWFAISFFTIASLFIVGMFMERAYSSAVSEWVYKIGTTWLAFLLYFLLIIISIDIIRLFNSFLHFLPDFTEKAKTIIGLSVIGIVFCIVIIGHINAKLIQTKHIPITINKKVTGSSHVRILMASDLHFGAIIGESWEKKFLQIVQKEKPDLVLLCGDIVDGEIAPVLRKQLGKHLQEIHTPLGLYAITGNHEYIGGIAKALQYFESIHIPILRDSIVELENGIQIVGRNDISGSNFSKSITNSSLSKLLEKTDSTKPIIVMNHQPYNLQEAEDNNVDLHLSGHTHNGQLWPFNYITQKMFELSWGYKKKGNTHCYVSSGYGTWGPTVRLGNKPEVVIFDIDFK